MRFSQSVKSSARSGRRGDRSPSKRLQQWLACKSARSHRGSKHWISSGSKERTVHNGRDAARNEETEAETETDEQHQEPAQRLQEEEEGATQCTKSSSLWIRLP